MGTQFLTGRRGQYFLVDDPAQVLIVGLDAAAPVEKFPSWFDPSSPREFDERFVKSFLRRGNRKPVEVEKLDDGRLICIDGRARVLAMREVHRRLREQGAEFRPPLRVVRWEPAAGTRADAVQAALDVVDANLTAKREPLRVAEHVARLHNIGATDEQIAEVFGWESTQSVRDYLKLAEVPAPVRREVERGRVAPALARAFVGMRDDAAEYALRALAAEELAGAAARARVRELRGLPPAKPRKPRLRTVAEIQARLRDLRAGGSDLVTKARRVELEWVLGT